MKKIFKFFIPIFLSVVLLTGCEKRVGYFVKTGELNQPRTSHAATLLKDGNVLITGGSYGFKILNNAEIYLTKEGRFVETGNMIKQRMRHISITLPDGRVVLLGGTTPNQKAGAKNFSDGETYSDVVEIYNPKTGKFEDGGRLLQKGEFLQAILMQDGKIFIYGGLNKKGYISGLSEIYDTKLKTSKLTSQINYFRNSPAITVLKDGRILITGGTLSTGRPDLGIYIGKLNHTLKPFKLNGWSYQGGGYTATAEIYDSKTDKYTLINNMNYPRSSVASLLLPNGEVLIVGGSRLRGYPKTLDVQTYIRSVHKEIRRRSPYGDRAYDILDIELFNPETNKFRIIGKLNYAICPYKLILINNRYVLALGGAGKTEEIIDLKNFKTYPTEPMIEKRAGTATNIDKNKVLITGGYFHKNITKNTAEIFELNEK